MGGVGGTHFLVELGLRTSVAAFYREETQQLSGTTMPRLGTVSQSPRREESARGAELGGA